ncbi:MAG TPA: 2-hydroxyacid dehydrogenase [Rectinemataceae bacterium]|nr:2-hydroxyacid dehydrogenase [Rectinemataceae bacterium]
MTSVLVTFQVSERSRPAMEQALEGLADLRFLSDCAPEDRPALLARAEVLLSWNPAAELGAEDIGALGNLRFVQLLSAGADHLPLDLFPARVSIASNVGAYAEPMAEHVMAFVLALAKDLRGGHRKLLAGDFDQKTPNRRLAGMSAGILGYGGIGKASARLMKAFGMRVEAINRSGRGDERSDWAGSLEDLEALLPRVDVLLVCLPLTESTSGLIGSRELGLMKDDAILVNVARGEIIVERDLYEHLKSHPRFKAGIDAWWKEPLRHGEFSMEYPFLELDNLLGTPHNSGIVPGAMEDARRMAVDNVRRFLAGETVGGRVNREEYR